MSVDHYTYRVTRSPEDGARKIVDKDPMRTIGHRKERPITFSASAALLEEGARFNDDLHRLPSGAVTFIPKGVSRFLTHEEANQHQLECLNEGMAQAALERP